MKSIYPLWRRRLIHIFAKALGVLVHIEGFPVGSNRLYLRSRQGSVNTGRGGVSNRPVSDSNVAE